MSRGYQNDPRSVNRLAWQFWDQNTIATGDTSSSFFSNTAAKTEQQTNYPTNGQLPAGQRFICRAIGFHILSLNAATALTPRDMLEVMIGRVDLKLNDQSQLQGHVGLYPTGIGADVMQIAVAATHVNQGMALTGNVRPLETPIFIDAQRTEVLVRFLPAITLATSAIVRCYMFGTLLRNPS